jgi:hypothetical protein
MTAAADPPGKQQAQGERLTITLIPKAGDELRRLQERTKLSRTDLTNRAITLYEFLDAEMRAGHELFHRDRQTGETQLVRWETQPGQAKPARRPWSRRRAADCVKRSRRARHAYPSPRRPVLRARPWLPVHPLRPLSGLAGQDARTR